MFEQALLFDGPFRHFLCFDSFSSGTIAEMRRVIRSDLPWGVRMGSFYETRRLELRHFFAGTGAIPGFVSDRFVERMRAAITAMFGEPLSGEVQVLGHRMLPGQSIGIHNDNPGLGFENYRVIVQLSARHTRREGGNLNLHLAGEGQPAFRSIQPLYNMCVGFEAGPYSLHSVDEVAVRPRDALLYNFWHVGNCHAAETAVYAALGDLWREERDRSHPDSGLVGARIAGELLGRWGASSGLRAYAALQALATATAPVPALRAADEARWRGEMAPPESSAAQALAALAVWLGRAPRRTFDRERWREAAGQVLPGLPELPEPLRGCAAILFSGAVTECAQ